MPMWLWIVSIIGSGGLGAAIIRLVEGWNQTRALPITLLSNTVTTLLANVTNLQKRVESLEDQLAEKSKEWHALASENLSLKLFAFRLKMEVNDARTVLGKGPFYATNAAVEEPTLERAPTITELHRAAGIVAEVVEEKIV